MNKDLIPYATMLMPLSVDFGGRKDKAIAKKEGTTVEKFGIRIALQLAGMAPSGQWFLRGDGTWFKKLRLIIET